MEETQSTKGAAPSPKGIIIFLIAMVVIGAVGFAVMSRNNTTSKPGPNQQTQTEKKKIFETSLAPKTLVYGTWYGNTALIKSLDLNSGENGTIAVLSEKVKKVSVLSPDQLLYMNQTDDRDHGRQITKFQIKDKTSQAVVAAAEGFGIDDYVISPNKQFIATWEVSFASGSEVLQGGRSRVYAVNLSNPNDKKLLYDEVANPETPVHYPRAVLNNGRVFTDTFVANDPSGRGHSYGMGVSDFDGANKKDLENMQNGTYGTQPSLSPDGDYLVFAGYNGSLGDGKAIVDGFRRAILTPNTVELLDVNTLQRRVLSNLPASNSYPKVGWDTGTGKVITTVLSIQPGQTGLFSYDLSTNTSTKINVVENTDDSNGFVSLLSSDKMLTGVTDDSPSTLGNLGDKYASAFRQYSVQGLQATETTALALPDPYMQHIAILPQNYFQNVLGIQAFAQTITGTPGPTHEIIQAPNDCTQTNLQLCTFSLKTNLAPVREQQQSVPRCEVLAERQCQAKGITPQTVGRDAYEDCVDTNKDANKDLDDDSVCYDSPLYLYGTAGKSVNVKVQTPVYNDTPAYNDGYNVTLLGDGNMNVNGQVYSAINYDYRSNLRRIKAPSYGAIVAKNGVEKVLREYALGLGLNEKETNDLVKTGKEKVISPFVFISFFDHNTSKAILPLKFTPTPDNYLNVVFYYKLLGVKPNFVPDAPVFGEKIDRSGFTAIEVSEIVE